MIPKQLRHPEFIETLMARTTCCPGALLRTGSNRNRVFSNHAFFLWPAATRTTSCPGHRNPSVAVQVHDGRIKSGLPAFDSLVSVPSFPSCTHSHPIGHRAPLALVVPVGTIESSPALQCRVGDGKALRPGGTLEGRSTMPPQVVNGSSGEATAGLQESTCEALQASLRDAPKGEPVPGTEVPGYSRSSLPGRKTGGIKSTGFPWDSTCTKAPESRPVQRCTSTLKPWDDDYPVLWGSSRKSLNSIGPKSTFLSSKRIFGFRSNGMTLSRTGKREDRVK